MKARLAVVTGTRAEYGIFRPLLDEFKARQWPFDLYVTGSHLSQKHGATVREIEADGFDISARIDIELGADAPAAICQSIGLAIGGFGHLLTGERPDLLFILGDRFEALAIAIAAKVTGIPIAHLHGGEVTEGAIDEAFRHAITKMATLHFAAAEAYRLRIIQLGEHPDTVFNVGALGLDNLRTLRLIDKAALEEQLGFAFKDRNLLVTQHSLTVDLARSEQDTAELIQALEELDDVGIILTLPNADSGGSTIIRMMQAFAERAGTRVTMAQSLGTARYFSALRYVDAVVGNSSSGLIEVPAFGIPTVNVGDRQKGRLAGPTVISVPGTRAAIAEALRLALSPAVRNHAKHTQNPYGGGFTAQKICDIIGRTEFPLSLQKSFYDLPQLDNSAG